MTINPMKTVKSDSTLSDYSSGELTATDVSSLGFNDDENDSLADADDVETSAESVVSVGISWGPVHVREYERIVADTSTSVTGVPIGLGWNSIQLDPVSIEKFESDRIRKTNLKLSSITRRNILQNVFGYSEEDLRIVENGGSLYSDRTKANNTKHTNGQHQHTRAQRIGKKVKRASLSLLKGFTAASQSATMMPSSSMGHAY